VTPKISVMHPIFLHLQKRKYEILLFALLQHLFIGIFLTDLPNYTKVIWPINMLILGVASVGVFVGKSRWKKALRNILFLLVFFFPITLPFFGDRANFMTALNIAYVVFFTYIFIEIMQFLIRPSYINVDIISASACGYFLLLEISVFLLQYYFYLNPNSFKGINTTGPATIYVDFVYLCSVTITSIGFGDITPSDHHTKLILSLIGIVGQFYSVVLVGILFSKFTS
jgi:hypothetical protein